MSNKLNDRATKLCPCRNDGPTNRAENQLYLGQAHFTIRLDRSIRFADLFLFSFRMQVFTEFTHIVCYLTLVSTCYTIYPSTWLVGPAWMT